MNDIGIGICSSLVEFSVVVFLILYIIVRLFEPLTLVFICVTEFLNLLDDC